MKQKPFERLSDLLARFKQLSYTTKVFPTERDVKKYGHIRPEELRNMLLNELRFLRGQHASFEKMWSKTFKELEHVLLHAKDIELHERLHHVHEDLSIIRRSLFRSELAGWTDRELLDEWNEWERMKEFRGDQTREAIRRERQELLRSELTLRGLGKKLEKRIEPEAREYSEIDAPKIAAGDRSPETDKREAPRDDFFEEWNSEYRGLVEAEAAFWERMHRNIEDQGILGTHSVPLLKKRKRAHAERRHMKRSIGL